MLHLRLPRRAALAPLLLLAAGCVHSSGDHGHALHESEPNDDACCADPMGVLYPGDHVVVHGAISDDGFDPFDGFAFTAGEPIEVELRLYADHPYADLDVCLYDPALGAVIECFESPFDPEVGVVHVLAGGAGFHLVVNAFAGSSAYALELDVHPLHFAAAEAAGGGRIAAQAPAAGAKADRAGAFRRYGEAHAAAAPAPPPVLGAGYLLAVDARTGELLETALLVTTSEGTSIWMGNPDEAGASEGP